MQIMFRLKNKDKGFPVHIMKAYRGVEVKLHSFLNSARERERGEWLNF